jgi:hypothetical protein
MRFCTGINYAAGIIASLSFLSGLASPLKASSIDFRSVCQSPGIPSPVPLDSCVGTTGGSPTSVEMNLTVDSAGGTITDSIQGSMAFTIPAGNTNIDLYTRQAIIPLPGNLAFNNSFGILVWADQPVTGNLTVTSETCSFFTPLIGFGGGGDCRGGPIVSPIPYLGTNPDLANAAINGAFMAGEAIIAPGGTFSPGYWENEFVIQFSNGTAPTHINILFTQGSANLRSAVLAPEPATAAELGLSLGFMLMIAYRRLSSAAISCRHRT